MVKMMLFNATEAEETRVAILNDGRLDEFYIERSSLGSIVGNIYKARVTNLEPSIDAAFVDFGGNRHGFLHASDVMKGLKEEQETKASKSKSEKSKPSKRNKHLPIGELLAKGQDLIVQVTKEGIGTKAPTLTTYVSLPGRFLVFMPGTAKRGISRKIEDEGQRNELKKLIGELESPEDMGLIVRTAGAGQTKRDIKKDLRYLNNLWKVIRKRIRTNPAPATLYQENDLAIRTLRDLYTADIQKVMADSEEVLKRLQDFMQVIMPRHVERVKLHKGSRPLFDHYSLEKELESILERKIPLKSGGSLVIEQTEALVAIDVNSGKFKGEELEETAFKINNEAASEIARQIRLRDLGGLIISDFIDMRLEKHRRAVEKAFRDSLKPDRARIKVARMSPFGIIEITRQRVRPSLGRSLQERCRFCNGTGYVSSLETSCLNIIRKIRSWGSQKGKTVNIQVNSQIADFMNNHKRQLLLELEESYSKKINLHGSSEIPLGEIRIPKDFKDRSTSKRS